MVLSSFCLMTFILSSLSSALALQTSSFRSCRSFFFFSSSSFLFLNMSNPPSPIKWDSGASSRPGDFASRKDLCIAAVSRFFSSCRSRLPGSAFGTSSSSCSRASFRSCFRSYARSSRAAMRSSALSSAASCQQHQNRHRMEKHAISEV